MSTKRTFSIEIEISDEAVLGLIDAAGYGMNHWCRKAVVDEEAKTYTVYPDPSTYDRQVQASHKLTFDMIRNAIVALWSEKLLPDWFVRELLDGEIIGDSEVGDMIIQQACFRGVIFS